MPIHRSPAFVLVVVSLSGLLGYPAGAATVTVDLGDMKGVTSVGAFNRWDIDGNHRKPVNPKAKIDAPEVDAVATSAGDGKWVFNDLKPGNYDLVIMGPQRTRIEGFTSPSMYIFSSPSPHQAGLRVRTE